MKNEVCKYEESDNGYDSCFIQMLCLQQKIVITPSVLRIGFPGSIFFTMSFNTILAHIVITRDTQQYFNYCSFLPPYISAVECQNPEWLDFFPGRGRAFHSDLESP